MNSFIQLFNQLLKVYDVDFALMPRTRESTLIAGKRLEFLLRVTSWFSMPDSSFCWRSKELCKSEEASLLTLSSHFSSQA